MNHRLSYLRDTAIGRFIEDLTIKNINFIIHYNNSEIFQHFIENKNLLEEILNKINEEDIQSKYDGISFLSELISCTKELVING